MTQPISLIAKSLVRERLRTGLSLAEIARRAGIAKSTLSQLESGNGNPSLETLWSLCVALDIPFARLLEPQLPTTQVIRRGEGTKVVAGEANYEAILLADRIVALKANPGEIKEIIEVDLPRPRSSDVFTTPEFRRLRERVDALVHAQEDELDPALAELPKIPRMTQISTKR